MGSRSTNGAKRRTVEANAPARATAAAGKTAAGGATVAASASANGTATTLLRAFSRELARAGGLLRALREARAEATG